MKIQRLFLRNVRSIKNLDLDFRGPFTGKPMSRVVIFGANGSGKTTILESIFGILSSAGKFLTGETTFSSGLQNVEIALGDDAQLQLLLDVDFAEKAAGTISFHYGPTNESVVTDTSIAESLDVGGRPKGPGSVWGLDDSSLGGRLSKSIQKANGHKENSAGSILYFPNGRYLPAIHKGELSTEPEIYQWAFRYKANTKWKGSTESYLFSLNYFDLEDRDKKKPADRFGQAVELVNIVLDRKRIARIEKGRVVVETDKGEMHGLEDLSSGEKQIVLLLIEILRRIVPGSVVLIDEPEISLHTAWQRGLMAALDKIIEQYDAQVILATHSEEIATSVMPYETVNLNDLGLPLGKWEPEKEALA
ncbi:MAG: AAA family ATPase [Chloroflexota bacterium]